MNPKKLCAFNKEGVIIAARLRRYRLSGALNGDVDRPAPANSDNQFRFSGIFEGEITLFSA